MTVKIIPHPEEGGTAAHIDVALIHWKKGRGHEIRKKWSTKAVSFEPSSPPIYLERVHGDKKTCFEKAKKILRFLFMNLKGLFHEN